MRFAFIDVEKALYPLRILCRVLRVSRSGYYAWRGRKPSVRSLEDERLRPRVVEAFKPGEVHMGVHACWTSSSTRGSRWVAGGSLV